MKTNIRIFVQDSAETADIFAKRLEEECNLIRRNHKEVNNLPVSFMTTAADGRQTATLQYFTKE